MLHKYYSIKEVELKDKNVVIINGVTKAEIWQKILACIVLSIVLFTILILYFRIIHINNSFVKEYEAFVDLNKNTVFSIDRVYLYSNAGTTSNEDSKPEWNVNINQYTDICLYINNRPENGQNYENSIKELYISDISFSDLNLGQPSLYHKSLYDLARFTMEEQDLIKTNQNYFYEVINSGDIDYSKSQIYANCQNPIILEYVNAKIKENYIISDISKDMTFDGSILKTAGVLLDDIACTVSFKINIRNFYDQEFTANVYIPIPLYNNYDNTTIYDGKFVKQINSKNYIKFYRIK